MRVAFHGVSGAGFRTTVLPVAFGLFSLQFPAGLVLYFLVSNLWRLGQQELIIDTIMPFVSA